MASVFIYLLLANHQQSINCQPDAFCQKFTSKLNTDLGACHILLRGKKIAKYFKPSVMHFEQVALNLLAKMADYNNQQAFRHILLYRADGACRFVLEGMYWQCKAQRILGNVLYHPDL
jgi:hypothetical protein